MNKQYGKSRIQRNWNRMSELTKKFTLSRIEKAELSYRISVQNHFASTGEMPRDYIPVGITPNIPNLPKEITKMNNIIGTSSNATNKLWHWSKINNMPFLALRKKTKYASLDYDMWTVNFNLHEKAIEQLRSLWERAVKDNFELKGKKSVWYTANKSTGTIWDILIEVALKYLPELEEIVLDKNNWITIQNNLHNSTIKETSK